MEEITPVSLSREDWAKVMGIVATLCMKLDNLEKAIDRVQQEFRNRQL